MSKMTMITVDSKFMGHQLIPEGDYTATLMESIYNPEGGRNEDHPELIFRFVFVDGNKKERKHTEWVPLPDDNTNTGWKLERIWSALKVELKQDGNNNYILNFGDLAGKKCRATVTHRVWEKDKGGDGKTRANVAYFKR